MVYCSLESVNYLWYETASFLHLYIYSLLYGRFAAVTNIITSRYTRKQILDFGRVKGEPTEVHLTWTIAGISAGIQKKTSDLIPRVYLYLCHVAENGDIGVSNKHTGQPLLPVPQTQTGPR